VWYLFSMSGTSEVHCTDRVDIPYYIMYSLIGQFSNPDNLIG
jgi:hypothetical protein